MKLRDFRRLLVRIDFIDDQKQWFMGTAKELGEFKIGSGDAASAIDNEEDKRGRIHRNLGLLENSGRNFRFFARNDAAGIHNFEGAAAPFRRAVNAIAGDSRLV